MNEKELLDKLEDVSGGVDALCLYGKVAYREWLKERLRWVINTIVPKLGELAARATTMRHFNYRGLPSRKMWDTTGFHRAWLEGQLELVEKAIQKQEIRERIARNIRDRGYNLGRHGWIGIYCRSKGHHRQGSLVSSVRFRRDGKVLGNRNISYRSRERREYRAKFVRDRDRTLMREYLDEVKALNLEAS